MTYKAGDALPPFVIERVAPEAMVEWAEFLADPNPIHLDPEAVEAKGLGRRVINQGPANVAYMMNLLHAAFSGGRIEEMETRFLDNVYGGDRAIATGTVTAIGSGWAECTLALEVEGRPVNTATAKVVF